MMESYALLLAATLNAGTVLAIAAIAGRVGLRRVDAGNLLSANDANGLFTLTQTQPVSVVFSVPEPQVAEVRAARRPALVLGVPRRCSPGRSVGWRSHDTASKPRRRRSACCRSQ